MIGRQVPDTIFKTRVRDASVPGPNPFRWEDVPSATIFAPGRRVAIFSLPGAFTPTCSNEQCPGFEQHHDALIAAGVDAVYCISVNDAFVMFQWARQLGLEKVKMLPDGNGDFTRRMGMLVDKRHLGFGLRSWRYAMVVDDGVVVAWWQEPGINDAGEDDDPYVEARPEHVLAWAEANSR